MNLKRSLLLSISTLFLLISPDTISAQSDENIESISKDEIKNHMYFLASDFMNGRTSYSPEYKIAAEYASSQFKSIGLKPFFEDKSGNKSYFQDVPLVVKKFGKNNSLQLINKKSVKELKHIDDFKIPVMMSDYIQDEIETVFIGYGINEEKYGWNDFKELSVENKAVFMIMDAPVKNGEPILPKDIHESYLSFQGFNKKIMNLAKMKPAVIIILVDDNFLQNAPWDYLPTIKTEESCFYDGDYSNLAMAVPPIYVLKPEVQKDIFKDAPYSPEDIQEKGITDYKTYYFKDLKIKMSFDIEYEKKITSKNIAAYVEGTDPVLKKEFISVGAHLDHLPTVNGKIYNGADDNASGSTGVIECSEAMISDPPKRSVLFILYTAEELGLYGSSHFLNNSPIPIEKIKFNINLDMIGRSIPENKDKKTHRVVIYDEYFNKIKKFIESANNNTLNWSLDFINAKDKQGDSDHTSFYRKGIPSFQFASGHHKDYHQPTDDAKNIDFEKLQKITQLTYIIAYRLANSNDLNFNE